jgi:inhibitor of KinA
MTRSVLPFGDTAVLVDVGWSGPGDGNEAAHRFADAVRYLGSVGDAFGDPVPGLGNVLVPFDPNRVGVDEAIERLTAIPAIPPAPTAPPDDETAVIELPIRYGGGDGPDLEDVARHASLTTADVVELHSSVEYRVLFLGFAPGFAYLGDVPEALSTARLDTPRERVPAGSVGIAGRQTAAYPFASPGGWRLIGRTDARLWDPGRPGSRVRFVPLGT